MPDIYTIVEKMERSVLVLGPGALIDKDGDSPARHTEKFCNNNQLLAEYYFKNDNLIRPKPGALLQIQSAFARHYKTKISEKSKALYKKISQIPFPLVISLNPDKTLVDCFDQLKMREGFVFDFYKKGIKIETDNYPTKDKPYLFNLFGSYEDPESLILTYNDLFDYFRNILQPNSLPDSVKSFLNKADNITFLGVEFDKWYFQLLVKLITEADQDFKFSYKLAAPDLSSLNYVNCICQRNFNITFVDTDIFGFINELYYHCYNQGDSILRGEPLRENERIYSPDIFISYYDDDLSCALVEKLVERGNNLGFKLIHYKDNQEFMANKWDFMKRIGGGKYIIVILNDKYLDSEYCMFEFKEIIDKGDRFRERIFPVLMADYDIINDDKWGKYEKNWKEKINMMKVDLNESDSVSLLDSIEPIRRHEGILASIPSMRRFLNPSICLNYKINKDKIFEPLFQAIDKKIENDLSI